MRKRNRKGQFVSVPLKERFWNKVNKNGPIHPYNPSLGSCWIWIGRKTGIARGNYGRINSRKNRRQLQAHRVAWELVNHCRIPKDKDLLHNCDNPACVNPSHTYPGTAAENHQDMINRGRSPKGERHGRATVTDKIAQEICVNFPLRKGAHGPRTLEERIAYATFFKKYKITYAVAWNIASGRGWRHLNRSGPEH